MLSQSLTSHQRSGSSGGGGGPFGFLKHAKSAVRNTTHKHAIRMEVEEAADRDALAALADGSSTISSSAPARSPKHASSSTAAAPSSNITTIRQQWLVSCVIEERSGLGGLARQLAGATTGSSFGPLSAVAICIGVDGEARIQPMQGLLSMSLALPPVASGWSGGAAVCGGSLLGAQGFVVAGEIALGSGSGSANAGGSPLAAQKGGSRRMATPVLRALSSSDGAGGASSGGGGAPVSPSLVSDPRQDAFVAGVVTAWEAALTWLITQPSGAPKGLRHLLPDLVRAREAGDGESKRAFLQMYQLAADLQMWPLYSGRLVHVREGAFLQPPGAAASGAASSSGGGGSSGAVANPQPPAGQVGSPPGAHLVQLLSRGTALAALAAAVQGLMPPIEGEQSQQQLQQQQQQQRLEGSRQPPADLGDNGRAFIQQHLALLDVPWGVKLQLDAAGVTSLRIVTPAVLRPLLRRLGQRPSTGGASAFDRMGVEAAVELLGFCCGDLVQAPEAAAAAAAGASSNPAASAAAAMAASGRQDSGGGIPGYPSTIPVIPLQPALPPLLAQRHMGRIRDLAGLPVPTALGAIVPLGSAQLLVVPPSPALPPSAAAALAATATAAPLGHPVSSGLLPASLARDFVHESCVAALADHLQDPELRRVLKLQYYGLPQIAKHFRTVLGPEWSTSAGWQRVGGGGDGSAGGSSAAVQWDDGEAGGPMRGWLRDAWRLCRAAADTAASWGAADGAGDYGSLGTLLMVPLADGRMAQAALLQAVLVADGGEDGGDSDTEEFVDVDIGGSSVGSGFASADGAASTDHNHHDGSSTTSGAERADHAPAAQPARRPLPEPWGWLVPMLEAGGLPVLDGGFEALLGPLTGPRPRVGRPPFLGPLVRKLAAAGAAGLVRPDEWGVQVSVHLGL